MKKNEKAEKKAEAGTEFPPDILARIANFPALPAMCKVLIQHWSDPNVDFKMLAAQMRYDPGMTANVLKLANSAYFGTPQKVDSLQTALGRLGMRQAFQLLAAQGMANRLAVRINGYDLEPRELLKHSVWVAVAAEGFARELKLKVGDMLFTAGLLHDLGKLILDEPLLKVRPAIEAELRDTSNAFDEIERTVIGADHAETGARLLEIWNFPRELAEAVRHHHHPENTAEATAVVVHLADILAYSEGLGDGLDGFRYAAWDKATASLGLKVRQVEKVASETLDKMRELEGILMG